MLEMLKKITFCQNFFSKLGQFISISSFKSDANLKKGSLYFLIHETLFDTRLIILDLLQVI